MNAAPGFGIYMHWPFCLKKCPYCDFNSHVRDAIEHTRWRAGLLAEIDHFATETRGRTVTSIFFGGGTPSLMTPETVSAVIERIAGHWRLDDSVEITLEANPTSVEAAKFRGFRAGGVNRVSLGVQSLNDASLRFLSRAHSADEAYKALDIAAENFDRHSFDLIYALPGQRPEDWARELEHAIGLAKGHLSVYQLTIEPGTAFHTAHARGDFAIPDDDVAGELYELTQQRLSEAGLPAYEISNHAAPANESRHNLTYWRYGDYLGIGPGAHGRLTIGGVGYAIRQSKAPETWLAQVEAAGHGTAERTALDADTRTTELVMMGLRLAEGIPRKRFRDMLGTEPENVLDADGLALLTEAGLVTLDDTTLTATAAGRQLLNSVLARLLRVED